MGSHTMFVSQRQRHCQGSKRLMAVHNGESISLAVRRETKMEDWEVEGMECQSANDVAVRVRELEAVAITPRDSVCPRP